MFSRFPQSERKAGESNTNRLPATCGFEDRSHDRVDAFRKGKAGLGVAPIAQELQAPAPDYPGLATRPQKGRSLGTVTAQNEVGGDCPVSAGFTGALTPRSRLMSYNPHNNLGISRWWSHTNPVGAQGTKLLDKLYRGMK